MHRSSIAEGNEKYRAGDFEAALTLYKKANEAKDSDVSRYDMGNAFYQLGDYEASAKMFGSALESKDAALARTAKMNFANAQTALGSEKGEKGDASAARQALEGAVSAYRDILLKEPDNKGAKRNMEIALKKLEELKDEENKNGKRDKEKGGGKKEKEQNGGKGRNEEQKDRNGNSGQERREAAKKEQAEKLLQNLSNEEQKVQKQLRRGGMPEKEVERDW
ncbi:MAG: hypothetical protein HZA04_05340 [Nitrospinae bacterium]|nr:hypothetical protein [Nitrospinota bacterium]